MSGRADASDGLLLSRVDDALRIARDSSVVKHIGFLDEREAALCASAARRERDVTVTFFGGYEGAERTVMGVFPPGEPARWPIAAITLRSRRESALSHRDYLGSLMALGITRDSVGDLLCEEGRCVLFVTESVAPLILRELDKVGREGVRVSPGFDEPLPAAHRFRTFSQTVASLRLDGVVAALCGTSRTHSTEWIRLGLVSVNGTPCDKASSPVREGDRIAVRGKGKYIVDGAGDTTRKGRVILTARQYL